MGIKVSKLRSILQSAIDVLDDYEDNESIRTHPNTYRLNRPMLEVREGFIELDELELDDEDEDEDEDD